MSGIDYFHLSRLPGEPLEGVEDVHFHPSLPRTARVLLNLSLRARRTIPGARPGRTGSPLAGARRFERGEPFPRVRRIIETDTAAGRSRAGRPASDTRRTAGRMTWNEGGTQCSK